MILQNREMGKRGQRMHVESCNCLFSFIEPNYVELLAQSPLPPSHSLQYFREMVHAQWKGGRESR